MGDSPPTELISLADDGGNIVSVDVLGRSPRRTAGLDAQIAVRAPFAPGRTDLALHERRVGVHGHRAGPARPAGRLEHSSTCSPALPNETAPGAGSTRCPW
ncbi:DUF5959 family protein [Streptomyces massasporeus]|uniref:DUF5959 family protein n=1 Tax=Streptomyces massasporeus TaxID=67324 RepID=UPI0033AA22CC